MTRGLKDLIYDSITGLYKREPAVWLGLMAAKRASNKGISLSVVMIDLDGFGNLNEKLGHPTCNEVLLRFGKFLKEECCPEKNSECICARYGGDEFIIIMPGVSADDAVEFMNELREKAERKKLICDEFIEKVGVSRLSFSYGVSEITEDFMSAIKDADKELYYDKRR